MPTLLLSLALLAAPATAAVKNPGTLVYATSFDSDGFDPHWAQNMSPLFNVYEPLVDFRGSSLDELVPVLAQDVPTVANGLLSPDGRTYRFPIRKGVTFHDGSTLTAEDVRYSLLRFMLLDRAGGPSAVLLEPVLGVRSTRGPDGVPLADLYERAAAAVTVEGSTVVLRLPRPFAPLLGILANLGRVVSQPWSASHGQWDGRPETWKRFNNIPRGEALDATANGTGAFRLERVDPRTRDIVLVRHEGYWRGPAKLSRVVIKQVPQLMTRRLMLEAGDADVVDAAPSDAPKFSGLPGVRVTGGLQKLQASKMLRFVFRVSPDANPNIGSGKLDGAGVPPDFFSDKDVRKAFAYAIDYDAYLRDVYKGGAARLGGLIPPGLVGHRPGPGPYAFDLAKAESHLKAAFGGEVWRRGFKVVLLYAEGSDDQPLAAMIRRSFATLGARFQVEPRALPASVYMGQVARRLVPLRVGSWTADYPDPHDFVSFMHTGTDLALGEYSDPRADGLLDRAVAEVDRGKRAALYAELQALADEELPRVPIGNVLHSRVERAWVKGFVFKPAAHNLPYDSVYYELSKEE